MASYYGSRGQVFYLPRSNNPITVQDLDGNDVQVFQVAFDETIDTEKVHSENKIQQHQRHGRERKRSSSSSSSSSRSCSRYHSSSSSSFDSAPIPKPLHNKRRNDRCGCDDNGRHLQKPRQQEQKQQHNHHHHYVDKRKHRNNNNSNSKSSSNNGKLKDNNIPSHHRQAPSQNRDTNRKYDSHKNRAISKQQITAPAIHNNNNNQKQQKVLSGKDQHREIKVEIVPVEYPPSNHIRNDERENGDSNLKQVNQRLEQTNLNVDQNQIIRSKVDHANDKPERGFMKNLYLMSLDVAKKYTQNNMNGFSAAFVETLLNKVTPEDD